MKITENKKILWIAAGIIVVVSLSTAGYFIFFHGKPEEAAVVKEEKPGPEEVEEKIEPLKVEKVTPEVKWEQVTLDASDNLVRRAAVSLSSHTQFKVWLERKNLVRKFVGATDNVVDGLSPRSFLKFLAPKGRFEVYEKYDSLYLDPSCYTRYNQVADVISSLSVSQCINLYQEMKPLIQEAYKQLGYPDKDFDDTLELAVVELLETPVVEGDIMLEKRVITYKMVDPKLENLTPAQKHLLRMGPRNMRKIQAKLREIARAIGIAESKIPEPRVYVPSNRK
ncbi:MAG: DUF3014 domain-containing protein [Candidatus Aminicenantales bacterium]